MGRLFTETELMEGRRKRDAADLEVILFRGGGCKGTRIKKKRKRKDTAVTGVSLS